VCVDIVDIVSLGIAWIRNESEKANLRQKLHDLSFFLMIGVWFFCTVPSSRRWSMDISGVFIF